MVHVRRWQGLSLDAIAERPACAGENSTSSLQYAWSSSCNCSLSETGFSSLYMPPFTFELGAVTTVRVTVFSSETGPEAANSTAETLVYCIGDPVTADIAGGSRSVRNDANFTLDATGSFDPSDPTNVISEFGYEWSCRSGYSFENDTTVCVIMSTFPLYLRKRPASARQPPDGQTTSICLSAA